MKTVTDLVAGLKGTGVSRVTVALVAVLGAAIYAFLQIADEVAENEWLHFDRAILLFFRAPGDPATPVGPFWLRETMTEITSLGGYPVLVVLVAIVIGYLLVVRLYGPALYVALSLAMGMLLSQILKSVYDRTRPDFVDHLVDTHTASFPSGHATMSTVVYLTLAALIVRLVADTRARIYVLAVAVLVSFAVGVSRVYLGVHYPTDVAAGWALGAGWASLSWLVVSWLRERRARRQKLSVGESAVTPR